MSNLLNERNKIMKSQNSKKVVNLVIIILIIACLCCSSFFTLEGIKVYLNGEMLFGWLFLTFGIGFLVGMAVFIVCYIKINL